MIYVITGAPGAGKGTQAELLCQSGEYSTLSTGAALRKHVQTGTEIGKVAGAIMERGDLVPDDVLLKIIEAELGSRDSKVILDGYPRNLEQAKTLQTLEDKQPLKGVIHLDVPRDDLIERLSGRRVCEKCGATFHVTHNPPEKEGVCDKCGGTVSQRADDQPASVANRLDVYEESTAPILDYYKQRNLYYRVEGGGEVDAVQENLSKLLASL